MLLTVAPIAALPGLAPPSPDAAGAGDAFAPLLAALGEGQEASPVCTLLPAGASLPVAMPEGAALPAGVGQAPDEVSAADLPFVAGAIAAKPLLTPPPRFAVALPARLDVPSSDPAGPMLPAGAALLATAPPVVAEAPLPPSRPFPPASPDEPSPQPEPPALVENSPRQVRSEVKAAPVKAARAALVPEMPPEAAEHAVGEDDEPVEIADNEQPNATATAAQAIEREVTSEPRIAPLTAFVPPTATHPRAVRSEEPVKTAAPDISSTPFATTPRHPGLEPGSRFSAASEAVAPQPTVELRAAALLASASGSADASPEQMTVPTRAPALGLEGSGTSAQGRGYERAAERPSVRTEPDPSVSPASRPAATQPAPLRPAAADTPPAVVRAPVSPVPIAQPAPAIATVTSTAASARSPDRMPIAPRQTDRPLAQPDLRPIAPAIVPALQAFGAAMRQAFADERRPARLEADPAAFAPAGAVAAPVAALPAPAILDTADRRWPHAMAEQIERLRDASNEQSTRIRLLPDALGPVDVAMRREGDTVHVHFTAAEPQTRQLLADAQPRLADAADARGLKLGRADVSGGDLTGDPRQQQRQLAQRSQPSRPAPARARAAATDPTDTRIA